MAPHVPSLDHSEKGQKDFHLSIHADTLSYRRIKFIVTIIYPACLLLPPITELSYVSP